MGWFTSMKIETLRDLFIHELEDLYDAETRLTEALPKMAEAASSPTLKAAFKSHLKETRGHVTRLERIFADLGEDLERKACKAMKGLVAEGDEVIGAEGDPVVKDAALIAAAQRVEHYEIAGYGTARAFARRLGLKGIPEILTQTLNEEGKADKHLTAIAENSANPVKNRKEGKALEKPVQAANRLRPARQGQGKSNGTKGAQADLKELTVVELRRLAAKKNVSNSSRMKKSELVKAIQTAN